MSILILQPAPENPTIVLWIRFQKSASMTLVHPALKGTITIDRVVEIDWISRLGRPLYVHPNYPFRELPSYHLE